ncbi:SDR family oxidoreductase [Prosthecobacter sp.]|uniref:SDR family NAD(P)-dependent oxidoreductase n=1 Tax=Prosthecobacter sp. TaxID=1965333 RepID=UPI0024876A2D|nr:SDR family oxidoreductase [Prosthecobacter sp.]MDI1311648.1 SDR family NAD(P)-dependent oxidoreductase [Prosthecobacter sp.]
MNLNLKNHSVAVIGAARGIGRAIADGFVAEGCSVRGFDRDKAADFITAGDVASYMALQDFAAEFESVNHVVFCVGIGSGKFGFPFWNLDPSDWARVLEVNLIGAVNVAHAFAPKLIKSGGGSMLFLVSVAGQMGSQTDPPYSASKAALINFTQCAAKDLGPHNVRVNALAPGMVKTELNHSIWAAGQKKRPESEWQSFDDWAAEKIKKVSHLGRWQMPEEYAAMATFLASDHAKNITGQTINIDGGQVMHA